MRKDNVGHKGRADTSGTTAMVRGFRVTSTDKSTGVVLDTARARDANSPYDPIGPADTGSAMDTKKVRG